MASSSSTTTSPTPSLLPSEPLPWRPNTRPKLPPGALLDIPDGPLMDIFTEYVHIRDICALDSALCQKRRRPEFLRLVSEKVLLFNREKIVVLDWRSNSLASTTHKPLRAAALKWILKRGIHLASLHLSRLAGRDEKKEIRAAVVSIAHNDRLNKLETICFKDCFYIKDVEVAVVLSKCIRSVKSIDIRLCGLTESSAAHVKHCTDLEAFAAQGNESAEDMVEIFQSCRKLRMVRLKSIGSKLTDEVVQSLAANCRHLEHVDLYGCSAVSDAAIRKLTESCPLLQYVNFRSIAVITDATVVSLCRNCPVLSQIYLSYCVNLTDAAVLAVAERLPGLTHISLDGITAITSSALEKLASKCRELEHIDIESCSNVSDVTLSKIAEHCSKLEYVYVTGCPEVTCAGLAVLGSKCSRLTNVFVDDRVEILAASLRRLFPRVTWYMI